MLKRVDVVREEDHRLSVSGVIPVNEHNFHAVFDIRDKSYLIKVLFIGENVGFPVGIIETHPVLAASVVDVLYLFGVVLFAAEEVSERRKIERHVAGVQKEQTDDSDQTEHSHYDRDCFFLIFLLYYLALFISHL